jgi:hypothetical protein
MALTLGLTAPAGAQSAARPAGSRTAPGAEPAVSAEDLAKVRAALQQLNAERDHINFEPADDDAPVVTAARPVQSGGIASLVTADGSGAPTDPTSGSSAPHRKRAGADVRIRINDQLKSFAGVDLGPLDVTVGNKIVLSLKY